MGSSSGWLGHTGELPGYNTAGYYLPEKKATIVVFVNSDVAVGDKKPGAGDLQGAGAGDYARECATVIRLAHWFGAAATAAYDLSLRSL